MKHFKNPFIFLLPVLLSCQLHMKFDKEKWQAQQNPEAPAEYRKKMLHDLTTNYKLKGLSYTQLINLLGTPNYADSSSLTYAIEVDYGLDIDPVHTKNLEFYIGTDSAVKDFKILEWKK